MSKIVVPFTKAKFVQALDTLIKEIHGNFLSYAKVAELMGIDRKTFHTYTNAANTALPGADKVHKMAKHFKPKVPDAADVLLLLKNVTIVSQAMQPQINNAHQTLLQQLLEELQECLMDLKHSHNADTRKTIRNIMKEFLDDKENKKDYPLAVKYLSKIFAVFPSWHVANCSYQEEITEEEIFNIFEETKKQFKGALGLDYSEMLGDENIEKGIFESLSNFDKNADEYCLIAPLISVKNL